MGRFKVGTWYYNTRDRYYGKLATEPLYDDNKYFYCDEYITDDGNYEKVSGARYSWDWTTHIIEADMDKVREFLPDGHPEKSSITRYCLHIGQSLNYKDLDDWVRLEGSKNYYLDGKWVKDIGGSFKRNRKIISFDTEDGVVGFNVADCRCLIRADGFNDFISWKGKKEQKYYPDLSQHFGRYLKTLVDEPNGGWIKKGEYGKIISDSKADFESQQSYYCVDALSEYELDKKYELMPEGFRPHPSGKKQFYEPEADKRVKIVVDSSGSLGNRQYKTSSNKAVLIPLKVRGVVSSKKEKTRVRLKIRKPILL